MEIKQNAPTWRTGNALFSLAQSNHPHPVEVPAQCIATAHLAALLTSSSLIYAYGKHIEPEVQHLFFKKNQISPRLAEKLAH